MVQHKKGQLIGYARVSSTDQKLDVQLDQLKALGVDKVYAEKASGADAERIELAAMLDYVRGRGYGGSLQVRQDRQEYTTPAEHR